MEFCLLTPAAFHRRAEPYKRIVGVLLRATCVSVSVSNPYLTLAEPAGAFLLRNGRVPERTFLRLLKPYCQELTGIVLGCETHPNYHDLLAAPQAADTLHQVHAVLRSATPGLPYTWWDRWSPDAPASCRIDAPPPSPSPREGPPADPAALQQLRQQLRQQQQPLVMVDGIAGPTGGDASGRRSREGSSSSSSSAADGAGGSGGGSGGGGGGGERCSMGSLFLQHYLDHLGSLNTFG